MNYNAYETPLRAVPGIARRSKARLGALKLARDAVHMAFPRPAIGRATRVFPSRVKTPGAAAVLAWLGKGSRIAAGLSRGAAILPSLVTVLSTPPIPDASARAARSVSRGIARISKAASKGNNGLFGRRGSPGTKIVKSLSHAGRQSVNTVRAVAKHPMTPPVAQSLRAGLALARPATEAFMAHRLLTALIPVVWLRLVFGLLQDGDDQRSIKDLPADGASLNRASRRAKQCEHAHAQRTQTQRT